MEKWKDQYRNIGKMPLMGLEIVNNTPETQSLKFFSEAHRHHMHKTSLRVRSVLGDSVYEDHDLRLLTDFIFDYRRLRIFATILNTSLLYGAFNGKRLSVNVRRRMNGIESRSFDASEHADKRNPTMAEIASDFVIDFWTELEQTGIEAGERLLVLFDLGNRAFRGMDDMAERADRLFGAEKKRKILLTM